MDERLPISMEDHHSPPRRWEPTAVLSVLMVVAFGPLNWVMVSIASRAGYTPTKGVLMVIWGIGVVWLTIGMVLGIVGAVRTMRDARLSGGVLAWFGMIANGMCILFNVGQAVKRFRGM